MLRKGIVPTYHWIADQIAAERSIPGAAVAAE